MRAVRLNQHRDVSTAPLAVEDVPAPEPGPGEVLVRVRACGVCHTDLHVVEGELPERPLPITPGHQVVGVVEATGRGASRLRPGARVGVPWLSRTCGECRFCKRGLENLCERGRFTGYDVDGGYAEYLTVHEEFAHPLPSDASDEDVAPLLCAGVIGYRALCLCGVGPGDTLGLYGFGASAHIVIQIARFQRLQVFVYTRSAGHRELARQLGAEWVGRAGEQAPGELDGAIVFAPAGGLVPLALGALRKGGTVALAGIHMSPIPEMEYGLLYGERVLRSVANSTRADVRDLLTVAAAVGVQTKVQTFPLEQANEALQQLKAGEIDGAGVLTIDQAGRGP